MEADPRCAVPALGRPTDVRPSEHTQHPASRSASARGRDARATRAPRPRGNGVQLHHGSRATRRRGGPGEWLAEVAPRSTFRPLRPSEAPIDPLDAELEGSFRETFTEPDPELELSGPVVEPEIAYGFTQAEIAGARRLVGRPIDGIGPIGRIWRRVTNPGEPGQLTLQNSRRLFGNQRGRFWRAVRQDPAARQVFEDAGFRFRGEPTTAPVKQLSNGETMQATIDHIVERQTDPTRALDPTNLRVSTRFENTVVLRQVTAQDPFQ